MDPLWQRQEKRKTMQSCIRKKTPWTKREFKEFKGWKTVEVQLKISIKKKIDLGIEERKKERSDKEMKTDNKLSNKCRK